MDPKTSGAARGKNGRAALLDPIQKQDICDDNEGERSLLTQT